MFILLVLYKSFMCDFKTFCLFKVLEVLSLRMSVLLCVPGFARPVFPDTIFPSLPWRYSPFLKQ